MTMQELQIENAQLAEVIGGFARVICALAGPSGRLMVTKAMLDAVPEGATLVSTVNEAGDVVFETTRPVIVPLEGPVI
jgi:hypothetical protein